MMRCNYMSGDMRDLTVEQVAEELQVNPRSVYKWIQIGELPAMDLGSGGKHIYRISRADLDAFKQARKTKPDKED
jgi:excisionase family DNA binding protein